MSAPRSAPNPLPRWAPRAAVLLLAVLLVGVAALRLTGFAPASGAGAAVSARLLTFNDTPDGGVRVADAGSDTTVQVLHGEQGFLRGVLRGLARERRANGIGAAAPYRLSLHSEGRLLITCTQTGRFIDLAAFGPDNAAVFARWLPTPPGARQP